jgi:hypothetical protein
MNLRREDASLCDPSARIVYWPRVAQRDEHHFEALGKPDYLSAGDRPTHRLVLRDRWRAWQGRRRCRSFWIVSPNGCRDDQSPHRAR